jgi:hypothetical protein
MRPRDLLPSQVRMRKAEHQENLALILGDSVEFLDAVTFGETTMILGNLDKVSVAKEPEEKISFAIRDLAADNDRFMASSQSLPAKELLSISTTAPRAFELYRRAASVATAFQGAIQTKSRAPKVTDFLGAAFDPTVPQAQLTTLQAMNVMVRRQYKKDPEQTYERFAKTALEADLQLSKHHINATIAICTGLQDTRLGNVFDLSSNVESWKGVNQAYYNKESPLLDKPIDRLCISKVILTTMVEVVGTVLASKAAAKPKSSQEKVHIELLTAQLQLMTGWLACTTESGVHIIEHELAKNGDDISLEEYTESIVESLKDVQLGNTAPEAVVEPLAPTEVIPESIPETSEEVEKDEPVDPRIEILGLSALAATVRGEHQDLRSDWDMSNSRLKKLGIMEFCRSLQNAYDGWDGVIDTESYGLGRTLQRLVELADTTGWDGLQQLFSGEDYLVQQFEVAKAGLQEVSLENNTMKTPATGELQLILGDVVALHRKWPGLRSLVTEFWPDESGALTVAKIEQVLGIVSPVAEPEAVSAEITPEPEAVFEELAEQDAEESVAIDDDQAKLDQLIDLTEVTPEPVEITLNPRLIEIAEQLDWEAFPADVQLDIIKATTAEQFGQKDADRIEWKRIEDLLQIIEAYGGTLYRSKPSALGGSRRRAPYFIAETAPEGVTFAIAENPLWGNSTYVLREDLAEYGASWQDVYQETRKFARLLGAVSVPHRSDNHLASVLDEVQSQLTVKPKTTV